MHCDSLLDSFPSDPDVASGGVPDRRCPSPRHVTTGLETRQAESNYQRDRRLLLPPAWTCFIGETAGCVLKPSERRGSRRLIINAAMLGRTRHPPHAMRAPEHVRPDIVFNV